jgi:hypothetical protein
MPSVLACALHLVITRAETEGHSQGRRGRDEIHSGFIRTLEEDVMKNQTSNRKESQSIGKLVLGTAVVLTMFALHTTAQAQSMTSFNDTVGQHAIFLGGDSHVHQLVCPPTSNCNISASWINQDLTNMAGGTTANQFSRLTSFSDAFGEHVFLADGATHIYQLFSSNGISWTNHDLGVQSSGGVGGYSSPGMFTYATTIEDRVFYETSNQHVHMLVSSNGGTWGDSDLTLMTGGTLARPGSEFSSFHDGNGEHVFYVGANEHLYQLYGSWISYTACNPFTGICSPVSYIRWTNQDISVLGHGPLVTGKVTSFSDATGAYVFYLGYDLQVHELQDSSGSWADQNLTIAARGVLPYFYSPLSGLGSLSNAMGRKSFYVGSDLNVHELILNSTGGIDQDLTTSATGPMAYACGGLELPGFTRASITQVESDIFYVANDGKIHRLSQTDTEINAGIFNRNLWVTSGWSDTNLISSSSEVLPFNACIQ